MRYSPNQKYNLAELLGTADAGDLDAMGTAVCLLTAEYDHADDPELEARIFRYLDTLVQNGESFANIMLADYYVRGRIAEQDIEKALSLYEAAVENGILFGSSVSSSSGFCVKSFVSTEILVSVISKLFTVTWFLKRPENFFPMLKESVPILAFSES